MPTVGTLTVAIEADVEGLKKGLNGAAAPVDQAARRMKASYSQSKGDKFASQV
jgi:hypothetical protein